MLTKRDLLSSLAGLLVGPILLLGLAYLVGGKGLLSPLNQAVDGMLAWIEREKQASTKTTGSISPLPEEFPDRSKGMTMTARVDQLPVFACPRKDCPVIASIPSGGKVQMLGKRAAGGETEWSHVQFERQRGWVVRHDLE